MRTIRGYAGSMIKLLLLEIPVSLVIAFLYWFVGSVLFRAEINFVESWRTAYLVLAGLSVLYDSVLLSLTLIAYWRFSRKWQVPYRDVEEAVLTYKLGNKPDFIKWDRERFLEEFENARDIDQIARSFTKAIFHA